MEACGALAGCPDRPVIRRATIRTALTAALFAVLAASCGQTVHGGLTAPDGAPASDPTGVCGPGQLLHAGDEPIPSAPGSEDAEFPWALPDPPVLDGFDEREIMSGGPPPDGIPPIDEPCFESVAAADTWLQDQSPVMVVEIDGDTRAYPLAILTRHEIVNDVISGEPILVTYCPLCNSGIAFHRDVAGTVLDFGTSGRLYRSNLVMYDRQQRNLWSQFEGRAVVGDPWVGTELEKLPITLLSWAEFTEARPDAVVLARPTGRTSGYGTNPYVEYGSNPSGFLYAGPKDERIDPDQRVVGISAADGSDAVAVTLDHLRARGVVDLEFQGAPLTLWWAPGQVSALDTATIDEGQDVGSTASFRPVADGQPLSFSVASAEHATFTDAETGSTWNLLGEAIAGPLEGERLEPVARDDTFWFVWFAFRPDTALVTG